MSKQDKKDLDTLSDSLNLLVDLPKKAPGGKDHHLGNIISKTAMGSVSAALAYDVGLFRGWNYSGSGIEALTTAAILGSGLSVYLAAEGFRFARIYDSEWGRFFLIRYLPGADKYPIIRKLVNARQRLIKRHVIIPPDIEQRYQHTREVDRAIIKAEDNHPFARMLSCATAVATFANPSKRVKDSWQVPLVIGAGFWAGQKLLEATHSR